MASLVQEKTALARSLEISISELNASQERWVKERSSYMEIITELKTKESQQVELKSSFAYEKHQLTEELRSLKFMFEVKTKELSKVQLEVTRISELNRELHTRVSSRVDEISKYEHEKQRLSIQIKELKSTLEAKSTEIYHLQQCSLQMRSYEEEITKVRSELSLKSAEYQQAFEQKTIAYELNQKLTGQMSKLITAVRVTIGALIERGNFVTPSYLVRVC